MALEQILGKNISTVKELRAEINALKDALVSTDSESKEWESTVLKLNAAQEKLSSVTNAGKQSIDAATDSIVGMEQQYKAMYNTYKLLTEEQRNSDFGKQMADSLNELSEKLNETKQGVGNFKDNIGHYASSAVEAFGQMGLSAGALEKPLKMASLGFAGLGAAMKAVIANPVGLIIAAIVLAFKGLVAIVKKVKESITSNEDSMNGLKEAMSAFQPVIDAVNKGFEAMGKAVVKTIQFIADAFRKIREIQAAVTDFFGITKGANERVKEQNKQYKELAKTQAELTKQKRESQKLDEADKAEVERLRDMASETENETEKVALLNQAKEKQLEIDQRAVDIAQKEVTILKTLSRQRTLTKDELDKLAVAETNLAKAIADKNKNERESIKTLKEATQASRDKAKEDRERIREIQEELNLSTMTDTQRQLYELKKRYTEELKLFKKYNVDTTQLTKNYNAARNRIAQDGFKTTLEQMRNDATEYQKSVFDLTSFYSPEKVAVMARDNAIAYADALHSSFNEALESSDLMDVFLSIPKDELNAMDSENIFKDVFDETLKQGRELIADGTSLSDTLTKEQRDAINLATAVNGLENELGVTVDTFTQLQTEMNKADFNVLTTKLEATTQLYGASMTELLGKTEKKLTDLNTKAAKALSVGDTTEYTRLMGEYSNAQVSSIEEQIELTNKYIVALKAIPASDADIMAAENEKTKYEEELALLRLDWINAEKEALYSMAEAYRDTFNLAADSINNVVSSYSQLYKAQIDSGKLDERETNKKKKRLETLQKIQTAVAVAAAVADTSAGIMGIWRGYSMEKVNNAQTAAATGPAAAAVGAALNTKSLISAIVQTAALAAQGTAQIAAIRANHISSMTSIGSMGGSDSSVSVSPVTIDSTPYSYTRTLQTDQEEEELNRQYVVSVVDIEDALNRVKVRERETTF